MESLLTVADNLELLYAAPRKDENARFKLVFLYTVK